MNDADDATPGAEAPAPNEAFRDGLLAILPDLRAFARSLCRKRDAAEDLTHDTVVNVLTNEASFQAGTNLKAWAFTIMRNRFLNSLRRPDPEPLDDEEASSDRNAPQDAHMEVRDLTRALWLLQDDQRQALVLVTVSGFSHEEAAAICGCTIGTMKSRVSRARSKLEEIMVAKR